MILLLVLIPQIIFATTVSLGASPVLSSAGLFLAKENGYFSEAGLDVKIQIFRKSGAPMTVPLSTGDLDVGGGNLSSGLWNALQKGIDIRLVADKGHIEVGRSYIGLLVRQDLVDKKKYKSFSDLKGYKMGLTSIGGVSQQIVTERFLRKGGLSKDDVTFIKMSYSDMYSALKNKQIEATILLEPYIARAKTEKVASLVAKASDIYPDQQSAAIFYSPHFIKRSPLAAQKFMMAYLKGVRAYENAFIKGKNRDQTIEKLKKYIPIKDDNIWNAMIPVGLNPKGYIDKKSLLQDLKWYLERGYISTLPDLDKVVDHSFVEFALTQLSSPKK